MNYRKADMKEPEVYIYASPDHLTAWLCNLFARISQAAKQQKKNLNIALSGGRTPELLFEKLYQERNRISWPHLHFFWVDERCVPPDHADSNYGLSNRLLFSKIDIPEKNIHRIHGENEPALEALRYGNLVKEKISKTKNNYPVFDLIMLGLGEDGHTASIFPEDNAVIQSEDICMVSGHPVSGQKRITLTLPVINRADRIAFLVSGSEKAAIAADVIGKKPDETKYPAAMVYSEDQPVEWYIDEAAASGL